MAVRILEKHRKFAQDLLAGIYSDAGSNEDFLEETFTETVLSILEEEGFWPDFELAYYGGRRGVGLNAWALDEGREILYLAITEFDSSGDVHTMGDAAIQPFLNRLTNFYERSREGKVEIAEYSPVSEVVQIINSGSRFSEVRFFLITNRLLDLQKVSEIDINGPKTTFTSWGLETIRRSLESGEVVEPVNIDFVTRFGVAIPCLQANSSTESIHTYLFYLSGEHLGEIHQEFGDRLLEKNVRSFLMARGKVNRGLRDTLRENPEEFLAYNNGLTVTAAAAEIESTETNEKRIRSLQDFQIVNGGQTTASISNAKIDPDVSIEDVFVQVKLVVVDEQLAEEIVPNITEFANSQNKVSMSDLSANQSFLRGLEKASRSVWTPSGTGAPTRWFFERARGSYNVAKSRSGSVSLQREFTKQHPTNQKITKSQIALYEYVWDCSPDLATIGGEKMFTRWILEISKSPATTDEENEDLTADQYSSSFKALVSKAILFREADKLIHQTVGGTYKRNITAYTISYLRQQLGDSISLNDIWQTQNLSEELRKNIISVCVPLKNELISKAQDLNQNVTEWTKKASCWEHFKKQSFPIASANPTPRPPKTREADSRPAIAMTNGVVEEIAGIKGLNECVKAELDLELPPPKWRWQKQSTWEYLGDSEVEIGNGETWHIFLGRRLIQGTGEGKTYHAAIDLDSVDAKAVDRLPPEHKTKIQQWLQAAEASNKEA